MLNVLLVENNANSTLLERTLGNEGFDFLKIQSEALLLKVVKESQPDVIIFNLDTASDNTITDLQALSQHNPLPTIVFTHHCCTETIDKIIKADVSSLIIGELPSARINSIISVAIARFNQNKTLKNSLEEAQSRFEDRKQIDLAKAILIKTQNFTEDKAYHTLRKLAMDRNITLGEIAKNVIAMAELLK